MLTDTPGSLRIRVAVIAERRPAASPWADWSWRVVEVLAEAPEVAPWTLLRQEEGRALFLAGHADVALHPTDTGNYKHNLEGEAPRLWVVLRPAPGEPGMALQAVTVDPGEAHLYADVGNDTLESLPLPDFLHAPLAEFVARHHRERGFWKRRRDQVDPEAMARRVPGDDRAAGAGGDGAGGPDGDGDGDGAGGDGA